MNSLGAILPFITFCFVMSGTPGPNNALALASGVRVGIIRSMPLAAGISVGLGIQLILVGFGSAVALSTLPKLMDVFRICGALYIIWLAYCIARSGSIDPDDDGGPLVGFIGGAAFQWINPKAWAVTAGAVAVYMPSENFNFNISIAAVIIALVAFPSVILWAACGTALRRFLIEPARAQIFNLAIALLLVATTLPLVLTH